MELIVYKMDDGGVMILTPTEEALRHHTIHEIAEKDVPHNKPYKIIDSADVPQDRTFRDAWSVDEATLTDGVGGEHKMFITDPHHPDYVAPIEDEASE